MSLPISVIVAQWVALFTLGLLVIVMYRQLAVLLDLKRDPHRDAASIHGGLAPGSTVADLVGHMVTQEGETPIAWTPQSSGRLTILAFADPLCGSCERAVLALNELMAARPFGSGNVDAYIVSLEDPNIIRAVDAFRTSLVPVVHVDRDVVLETFAVRATPYVYVIGINARILSAGAAYDKHTFMALLLEAQRQSRNIPLQPVSGHSHQTIGSGFGGQRHES